VTTPLDLPDQPLPSVGVVIPTRNRPVLLRRALDSIAKQSYTGRVQVIVVHDGTPLDHSVAVSGARAVTVMENSRSPGLAGARNTGITALSTDYIAFCDDDDFWLPEKLTRQIQRALDGGEPELVTCAITVDYEGRRRVRLARTNEVTHHHLIRSRMSMLHSSTLLFERNALLTRIGLVNEEVPGSQNEDWDLLLRAAVRRPIAHVDEPLAVIQWGRTSMFARAWDTKVSSLNWMLEHHPALLSDSRGVSRVYGQIAFGEAAQGNQKSAIAWARRSLRAYPLQWRAVAALPVAARVISAESVMNFLHRFGRGV